MIADSTQAFFEVELVGTGQWNWEQLRSRISKLKQTLRTRTGATSMLLQIGC